MSNAEHAVMRDRSLAKGLIAGLIGGLAGTVAKAFAERMFPAHANGESRPSWAEEEGYAQHELVPAANALPFEEIHWGFGASVGAAYGALAEFYPVATSKEGASFGMALEALTEEGALTKLGVAAPPQDHSMREHASEITSSVVFGMTTEMVRSVVRRLL
jgi:putative membrane protein